MRGVQAYDAEEASIQVVVQEHHFLRRLDDLLRWSDSRHAWRLTVPRWIRLDLPLVQILDLGDVLRLVHRFARIELGDADRLGDGCIVRLAGFDLRSGCTNPVIPLPIQIRMAVSQLRCRRLRQDERERDAHDSNRDYRSGGHSATHAEPPHLASGLPGSAVSLMKCPSGYVSFVSHPSGLPFFAGLTSTTSACFLSKSAPNTCLDKP